ncbi:heat shock protein 90kDa beta [Paragonimus westermani]|uniref:Heat shock protein 90kDa beta n=1 Tax=Paragonimus westermani TaxID=34504 RepID=A0A5J4NM80_9TREM|nr:heat shock protein 90kDa beta [Paragonimus westermani]
MGRKLFVVSSVACILGKNACLLIVTVLSVVLSCVFCDSPKTDGINVGKPSEGLSTASDTVLKEFEATSIDGFSAEQLNTLREQAEKREFQAEIFLRELISNASDALDKIRLLSLTDKDALNATEELSIRIKVNKEARTLHIVDTGIGMSKEDMAVNLGTIAQSGTSDFLAKLASSQSSQDADLIGQFGVGFYSGFLGDTLKRGTEIILFLNEGAADYLQQDTLTSIIKKYSQFINFPIYLWSSRVESVKVDSSEAADEKVPSEDADASVEEEKKDKPKTVEKTIWDWVHVNKYKPIWKRNPADITEDEYKDLYKDLSLDQDEPLAKVHFTAEADVSFTALLYLPKRSPGDIFNVNYSYKNRIKLHVHRIFISDAAEELVPKFLGFVIGIVDSDDLPLNVSRETLQQNDLVKVIRKKLTRKVIEMISKMSKEDFDKFWKEYSIHIKLGMIEDASNKNKLSKLLRYRTSKSNDTYISLMDYKSRMKKDQDTIYYLTGASIKEVRSSSLVERLMKMGYEVIFMVDAIDEYVMQFLTEFEKLPLQNVAKEGFKLKTSDTLRETQQKDYEKLLTWLKEDALKDKIEKAELSERLSSSPCALVASKYGWSGNMERIMRSQAHHKGDDLSSNYYSTMAKTFEINPRHPIIKKMNHRVKIDSSDREARETAELLFYVATLRSGYTIHDSVDFAQKIESIMRKNLDVDELEEVEAEPEETKDEDEAADEHKSDEDVEEKDVSSASDGPAAPDVTPETPKDTNQSCPTCRRLLQHAEGSSTTPTNAGVDEVDTATDHTDDDETDEDDGFHIIGETGDYIECRLLKRINKRKNFLTREAIMGLMDFASATNRVPFPNTRKARSLDEVKSKMVQAEDADEGTDVPDVSGDEDEEVAEDVEENSDEYFDGAEENGSEDEFEKELVQDENEETGGDEDDTEGVISEEAGSVHSHSSSRFIDKESQGIDGGTGARQRNLSNLLETKELKEEGLRRLRKFMKWMKMREQRNRDSDIVESEQESQTLRWDTDEPESESKNIDTGGDEEQDADEWDRVDLDELDDADSTFTAEDIEDEEDEDSDHSDQSVPEYSDKTGYEGIEDPEYAEWTRLHGVQGSSGTRKLLAVKPPIPTASTKKAKTVTPPTVPRKKSVVKPVATPTTTPRPKAKTVKLMETKPVPVPTHKLPTKSKKVEVKHEDSDDLNLQAFQSVLKKPAPKPKPKVVRVVGTLNDHDCDGIPDDIDEDIDNDGLLDRTQDSDWDGELNHVDLDDDNDGIPDIDDEDANGDGIPDCRADTSDHQLVVRFKKKKRTVDSDFDGIPDDVDKDDDDDGIPDIMEDEDGDQIPDWFNISLQDIEAEEDLHQLTRRMAKYGWHDHDCDGIPDDLDPDDDNDGFFDNKQDSDRDGILNEWDDDDDNDGIPDSEDPDSNGDGIPDCVIKDTDGDGIPDHIDTDDDNDGIPDLQDPDHPTFNYFKDSDNDGIPDILDKDDDNDGIPDHNDQDADGDGTHDYYQDVDKDGVPDALDDDMDNDGIPDHQQDHDCDGIPDIIDPDDDNDGYFDNKQDSDNDGILNEWDDDDDNDGIPDKDDPDSNGDGILDCQPRDSDGDGIPDHLDDDDDNDGIPDIRDPDSISFLLYKHKRFLEALPAELARNEQNLMNVDLGDPNDKDCDGIPDHLDNDQDNDGKIDRTQDSDMDGLLNHVDDDDDNDGIPDHLDPDANGDGIPDCRRDDDLHYKLVKSPSGLIKKVLRIRKPTQEEQHMTFMVNEAKRKLIKVRAMLNSPPPKKPLQTAHSIKSTTMKPEHNAVHANTKTIHPKILKVAGQSSQNPKVTKQPKIPNTKTQQTAVPPKPVVTKSTQQTNKPLRVTRKLASYTPSASEYSVEETVEDKWNLDEGEEEDDDVVDLISKPEEEPRSGSFLFPTAMATDAQTIKKAALQKAKLEAEMTKPKAKKPTEVKKPTKSTIITKPTISKTASAAKKIQTCSAPSCHSRPGTRSTGGVLPLPATKQKPQALTKRAPAKAQHDDDDDDEDEYLEDEDDDGIPDYLEGDSDGDGIPDYLEDEDGDGIPDYLEDEDGDGIPDYLDEDSSYRLGKLSEDLDGNGIPDHLEGDSDGDGILDYQEDSDGDGIPDYLEDSDGDDIPDYLDVDSPSQFNPKRIRRIRHGMQLHRDLNNDNIPDLLEGDLDGDGVPDYLEDEDDDGIPDYLEDEDGDGIPDYLDEDSTYRRIRLSNDADEDGIPDHLEGDSDGDGIPDYMEDSDGDGIPDYLEDSDGDGIPNYLDADNELSFSSKRLKRGRKTKLLDFDLDHDGIPDFLEGDSDGNGVPDYLEDSDGDGVPDYLEDSDGDGVPDYQDEDATSKFSIKRIREIKARQKVGDLDGDGIPDHLQGDSDGDGVPDYQEDTDGDGIPDYLEDSDGDGIPDYLDEDAKTQFSPKVFKRLEELKKKEDEDGDGIPDYLEGDSDGDGTPDYLEDSDGDGIPDYLEDSDGDGIPDYLDEDSALQKSKSIFKIEDKNRNGIPDHLEHDSDYDGTPDYLEDTDRDGIPDYLEDSDEDGIPDYLDEDATTQFSPKKIRGRARGKKFADADHDGIPDHLEGDMDNNGILDYLEDADGDSIPDYLEDTDKDGIPDYLDEDATTKFAPKMLRKMRPQRHYADVDGDGIPDHLELDNDGDGIPDYLEDTDGDGIPDYLEDSDGDGIPDYIDEDAVSQFSQRNYRRLKIATQFEDNDGDGIPDHLQGDSDGDGVLDFLEDSDGDGTPDYLEDSDGDGVPDYLDQDADSQFSPKFFTDKNRDGIPDSLEGDSDGDGIPDYLEDTDGDGIPDYLEDSDGDGIPNYLDKDVVDVETEAVVEGFDSDTNKNGIPDYLEDWDADGIPNYLDDDDGDGIADFLDRKDNRLKAKKKKGKYRKPVVGDKNENGIPDYLEGDSDGDGVLDYKQDTDKDGIPDYLDEDDVNAKFRKSKSVPVQKARHKITKKSRSLPIVRGKIDTDGDGIPDDEEDADGDGIPDYLDSDADGDGKPDDQIKAVDRNRNGIPDHLELKDSDGDGIIDLEDDDDDNDGIPDDEDDDDDNDGIKDYLEDENHNQKLDILEAKDTDGDGIPDYLDDDDDNDGIPDSEDDDDDGDGIVDKLEDENNNQIPDYLEMRDSDGDGIVDWLDTDDDNDNIPDYLDDDDDGDGIPDTEEDENKNNIPDILELRMKVRKPPSILPKKTILKSKQEPKVGKKSKVTISGGEDDDSDDGDDDEEVESGVAEDNDDEGDQTSQSSFRTSVNRVLRWIESIVGVENSSG